LPSDVQCGSGAAAQRYERQQGNHQTVSVLTRMLLAYSSCDGGIIHELNTQRIEALAGHEVMPWRLAWRRGVDPFGNGEQP
jgi:hypothetical protein